MNASRAPYLRRLPRYARVILAILSIGASLMAFTWLSRFVQGWLSLQLGPGIAGLFAGVVSGSAGFVIGILIFTFLFGRFYCAALCPLGILQDFIGWFVPTRLRQKRQTGNYPWLRYFVALAVFAMMAGGAGYAFEALDPYSWFGRMAASLFNPLAVFLHNLIVPEGTRWQPITDTGWIVFGAALPLAALIGLVVWKGRIFCTTLCPVGTLLGLVGKKGMFRLSINQSQCIACGQCTRVCPTGCIEISNIRSPKILDNERCVRCMNCMAVCPRQAVKYGTGTRAPTVIGISPSRRHFVTGGAVAAAMLGTGRFAGKLGTVGEDDIGTAMICPPGAGSPERFLAHCTNCDLCITVCRGNVLNPASLKKPAVHLSFEKGVCEYNCTHCMKVCPTGALREMPLADKQRWRIGMADLKLSSCITITEKTVCGACSEVCPTGALYMLEQPNGISIPALDPDACIGCGSCEYACPVKTVATRPVVVKPVAIQVRADDPRPPPTREIPKADKSAALEKPAGKTPEKSGEWLF